MYVMFALQLVNFINYLAFRFNTFMYIDLLKFGNLTINYFTLLEIFMKQLNNQKIHYEMPITAKQTIFIQLYKKI